MVRKRAWEIGATAALLLTVVLGGYLHRWTEQRRADIRAWAADGMTVLMPGAAAGAAGYGSTTLVTTGPFPR